MQERLIMTGNKEKDSSKNFLQRIQRGRRFEIWEREQWIGKLNERAVAEALTEWKGKRGRIDIKLFDEDENHTVIVELKATDWDGMKPHRVRSNVLRHARQVWRYIEGELASLVESEVIPAIVYPKSPITPGRKNMIEEILHEHWIQVVWRDEEFVFPI
jgi:hypothetical protein